MHTQRRYATCPQGMSKKKRRKYSPYQIYYKGERIHIKEFSSIIHHKYPHTCTSWSRLMTCFSFGSGLRLSKIWEESLPSYPPYLQIHQKKEPLEVGWKRKAHKRPWWGMKHIWAIREITRGTYKFIFKKKLYKTSGLTVEQGSGKWYSTSCSDPQ